MPKLLCYLLLLATLKMYSQEKKIYYYNDGWKKISENRFKRNFSSKKYLMQTFEVDTAYINVSFKRKNYGLLKNNEFENLISTLQAHTNKDLKNSKLIVINYYPGSDNCNKTKVPSTWNVYDTDYVKELDKITTVSQFWIYKIDENLENNHKDRLKWMEDKNRIVEKQFFKYHFLCGSFVVIDNQGNFISYYGEYAKQTVWEIAKELNRHHKKNN
ncbi:MAG: hypothetical protein R2797_08670 [Gelidibacter sp.]